jgi:hypothetical protein
MRFLIAQQMYLFIECLTVHNRGIGFGNNYSVLAYPASALLLIMERVQFTALTTGFTNTEAISTTRTV